MTFDSESRDCPQDSVPSTFARLAAWLLIAVQASLLVGSANCHSPVWDEIVRVHAGIHHWQSGDFSLNPGNPPLNDLIAAVPVMLLANKVERDDFLRKVQDSDHVVRFVVLSRLALIPLSVFGGWICFKWACELFGGSAGLFVVGLWCFDPLILAHGALNTGDMVATSVGIGATWAFWRWTRRPLMSSAIVCGIALGFALLAKYVWVILPLLWLVLWLARRLASWSPIERRTMREMVVMTLVAIYVVNAGFGFDQTCQSLNSYVFNSDALKSLTFPSERHPQPGVVAVLRQIPVPLPRDYLLGVDAIARHVQTISMRTYVHGEFLDGHVWYFYLYALLVKIPLGTWLLLVIAVFARVSQPKVNTQVPQSSTVSPNASESACDTSGWFTDLFFWLPAMTVLVFVSCVTSYKYIRYILPMLPFAFVWMGRAALWAQPRGWFRKGIVWGALGWSSISSLVVYPHSLSYFNEAAGGSRNGDAHLLGPNFDYGQDFLFLKEWIEAHPDAQPLYLECNNYVHPKIVGIDSVAVPLSGPQPGYYALSASVRRGSLWRGTASNADLRPFYEYLELFNERTLVARIGYSIAIYRLTCHQANAMRTKLRLETIECEEKQVAEHTGQQ